MNRTAETLLAGYGDALLQQTASGIVRWLHQNRAAILDQQKNGRMNWRAVAAMLEAEGIKDGAGNPPSADVIRRAWYRVRKNPLPAEPVPTVQSPENVLHNPEGKNVLCNPNVLHNPEPAHEPAPAKSALSPILPEQRSRPRRTMATLRGMEQAAQPTTAPATHTPASKPETHNADDVLRELGIEP